jgi:hypothetical protein
MSVDRQKFDDAIHYIVSRCSDPSKLGSVKLNKILWFSDARHYVLHGEPITGETYIRRQHGPVAEHLISARKRLVASGRIDFRPGSRKFDVDRYRSVMPWRPGVLSEQERGVLDYFITHICNDHTAASISDESHDYAWEIAAMEERLPYYAILSERSRPPNEDELEWARDAAKKQNLP